MRPKRSFLRKFFILPVFVLIACLSGLQAQSAPDAQRIEGYEYHGYIPFEPENEADEGIPGQTYDMLLDGDVDTKWCVDVHNRTSWSIQFATKDYVRVSGYCMVAADDTEAYSGRNPKSWKLEAKGSDGVWEVLDEVTDDDILPDKNQARGYRELNNTFMYCEFRLTFTGVNEGNAFQLSEFFLLYKDPDTDVRKPWIRLHPNTILPGINPAVVTGDNRSTVTLGGDPYNQEAYTLLGWNTHPSGTGTTYKADDPYFITRDEVVYAMWEAKQFELTINLENFEGSPLYRRIGYKTTAQFRLTPPEREGYIFKYWIVTSGGGTWKLNEKYDANTNIYGTYGNATLAGVWEKRKEIEVSWYSDDNLIGTDTYYEGDIPEYKGEKPEKESIPEYDFTFIGWDKELKELTEDTTFNAVFEGTRRSYEITWLDEDGSQFDVTSVEYGTVPSHEPPEKQPTKESCYVFEGWEETPVAVTGNATYKAVFREIPRPYEITWQYEDGSLIDVTEAGYGTMPSHADPNKKATDEYSYTFIGWDRELSVVDGPAVYTARFTPSKNRYEITWKDDKGEVIDVTTVEYGEIPQHENPVKKPIDQYSYVFAGWSPNVKAVTGAAEYKAQFSEVVNSYEIVWKDENGTLIDTTTVEYGSMPLHSDLNNRETREAYFEFDGWEPNLKAVTGPAEYKAKFKETKKSCEIIWKYENGLVIGSGAWEYGTVPSCIDPEMEPTPEYEYVFTGWDPEVTEVDGAAVYTAIFTPSRRSYVITWQDDEGNVFDTSMVEYDSIPSHEDPVKKDSDEFIYTFIGWNRDFKAVAGPETYVARFEKTRRRYEITWKDDDGEVIDITEAEYGSMPTHPDPAGKETVDFTFTFDGWTPGLKEVTGKAEYTAQYNKKPRNYPVHFEMNGAAAMKDASVEYGKSAEKPETPQYSGFFFDGWFADKELNKPYTFEEKITDETTIYAKWTAIKPAPVLSGDEKPTAIQPLTENGQPQALINAPKAVPEGYTVEYSLDGSAWSKEIPTGTKSGEYTVRVFYRGDNYHTGFTGENLTVKIQGVYKCDATTAEWTKKSGKTVAFRITKEFDDDDGFEKFTAVTVDGVTAVRDKDYTAVKGSTIITFSADFLETLSLGEHAVKVSFEDGEASVGIKVIEAALTTPNNDTSAQTGDSSHLVLWIIRALVSIGAIGVMSVMKKSRG